MKITKTVTTTVEITPAEAGEFVRSYGHGILGLMRKAISAWRVVRKEIKALEAEMAEEAKLAAK